MHLTGECRAGCGNCCRILVMPLPGPDALHQTDAEAFVPLPVNLDRETGEFYGVRGVEAIFTAVPDGGPVARVPKVAGQPARVFSVGGQWFARIPSVCGNLTTQGTCRIYESRPAVCRNGPTLWERLHVLSADECAIKVEE